MGKISVQPHTTLCIQFLNRENNDKNNTLPLGKQICFTIVWGCAEILPKHGALHKQHWTRYEERKEENRGRISVPINAKLTDGDNDYKRLSLFGFYILWKFKSNFFPVSFFVSG